MWSSHIVSIKLTCESCRLTQCFGWKCNCYNMMILLFFSDSTLKSKDPLMLRVEPKTCVRHSPSFFCMSFCILNYQPFKSEGILHSNHHVSSRKREGIIRWVSSQRGPVEIPRPQAALTRHQLCLCSDNIPFAIIFLAFECEQKDRKTTNNYCGWTSKGMGKERRIKVLTEKQIRE